MDSMEVKVEASAYVKADKFQGSELVLILVVDYCEYFNYFVDSCKMFFAEMESFAIYKIL